MKKGLLSLIFLFFLLYPSFGDAFNIQLRSSRHEGVLRIVIEGPEAELTKALVNQNAANISVAFPDAGLSVDGGDMHIPYRIDNKNTLLFSPGKFRGIKVFTLKNPSRLVIDIQDYEQAAPPPSTYEDSAKKITKSKAKTKSIVIDPGHGGYDSGIMNDVFAEKHIVLDISKKLFALLNTASSDNHLTRSSDRFTSQKERIEFGNSRNADVFLSLHVGKHQGIVIYVPGETEAATDINRQYLYNKGENDYIEETAALLYAMKKALIADFGDKVVSVKKLPYSFLAEVNAASLMIELPSFEDADYVEEFRADLAKSIFKGFNIYEEIREQ